MLAVQDGNRYGCGKGCVIECGVASRVFVELAVGDVVGGIYGCGNGSCCRSEAERIVAYVGDVPRCSLEYYRGQGGALTKRMDPDGRNGRGDGHGCEGGAVLERTLADGCNRVADGYRCEVVTFEERIVSDGRDTRFHNEGRYPVFICRVRDPLREG